MTEVFADCPTATMQSGLRVANFSSIQEYEFADGTVLPACHSSRAARLAPEDGAHKYDSLAVIAGHREYNGEPVFAHFLTVRLDWILSEAQAAELERLQADETIHLVIVSPEMMYLLQEIGRDAGKCRTALQVGYSGRIYSEFEFGG